MSWALTCCAAGGRYEAEMLEMVRSFRRHHPDVPVITGIFPEAGRTWQAMSNAKVGWLSKVRQAWPHHGLLWVDADARFRRRVEVPELADIGGRRYQADSDRVSTGTLWLSSSRVGRQLLVDWLIATTPTESNEDSLAAVLRCRSHRYEELSDAMSSVCAVRHHNDGQPWPGHIEHDSAIVHWNMSRAADAQDWPPSEEARALAPVVSVTMVTSCYNQGETLPYAIESVLAQTFPHFEYLLIDDGSTDDTWDVIQGYAAMDPRIRPIRMGKQDNVGVVLNESIDMARGLWWCWCPADDILRPHLLATKLAHPEAKRAVVYSHGKVIDGPTIRPPRMSPTKFRETMRTECPIGLTGILVPMHIFDRARFPTHLPYSEDFHWLLQACRADVDFVGVREILYDKRSHPNSITGRNLDAILANIDQIRTEVGWHAIGS